MTFRPYLKYISDVLLAPLLPGFFIDIWAKTLPKEYRFYNLNKRKFPKFSTDELKKEGVCKIYDDLFSLELPSLADVTSSIEKSNELSGSFKNYMINVVKPYKNQNDKVFDDELFLRFLDIATREGLLEGIESAFGPMELVGGGIYVTDAKFIDTDKYIGSQKWHFDRFSNKHVKAFINLSDIETTDGPTLIMKRSDCKKLLTTTAYIRALWSRYYRQLIYSKDIKGGIPIDISKYDEIDKDAFLSTAGPRGTVTIANTGSLLHCGGRVKKNGFRCFMIIHFCPTHRYINPRKHETDDWRMGLRLSSMLQANEIRALLKR